MFCKKGFPRNFTKFIGKYQRQSLFFNKVAGFIRKDTLAQVFSCGFWEISKNTFSTEPPVTAFKYWAEIR